MPKTKNAFAFRDFDADRILQRRFFILQQKWFSEWILPDMTDEEILQKMGMTDFDSFEETQDKLEAMEVLIGSVAAYQKHIKRHGDRLTRYARSVEYKITTDDKADIAALRKRHERATDLSIKYCGAFTAYGVTSHFLGGIAVMKVGGLCDKIIAQCKELDGKVKAHYRKIFATRLKEARKEMGLTQTDFGFLVGLSQRAISNFENADREPSIAALVKISKRTKRPIDWLLGAI